MASLLSTFSLHAGVKISLHDYVIKNRHTGVYELEWLRYQLGCFSTATFLKDEITQRGK